MPHNLWSMTIKKVNKIILKKEKFIKKGRLGYSKKEGGKRGLFVAQFLTSMDLTKYVPTELFEGACQAKKMV